MSIQIPAKLKSLDIQRFALRASQLETAKPSVAYWCEYWIVNQILAKGLHTSDAECLQYTTALMDKLEQTKAQHASDDVIIDDTAGQAYVEQFGLETFERADRAIRANIATKQTADTFLAAATFLELLNIWAKPEAEIHSKIVYAKWNATRIMKAIKEGKDPNESNPKPKPMAPENELLSIDPHDSEAKPINPWQPSIEDIPDEQDGISLAAQGSDTPHNPYGQSRLSGQESLDIYSQRSAEPNSYERTGASYFPETPTTTFSALPTAPPEDVVSPVSRRGTPNLPPPRRGVNDPFNLPEPSNELPTPTRNFYRSPQPQSLPSAVPKQSSRQNPYITDDMAITKARKHAKWAISALDFEDVNTAVRELQEALHTLGAS